MPRPVKDGSLRVGGRTVQVSSVGKPFFPDAGLVKGDLLAYYRDVAEVMLPYVHGRPLNLQRFPDGVAAKGHGLRARRGAVRRAGRRPGPAGHGRDQQGRADPADAAEDADGLTERRPCPSRGSTGRRLIPCLAP